MPGSTVAEFIVEGILMLGVSSAGVILNIIRFEFMSILILRSRHGTVEMYIPGPVCRKGSVN